MRLYCAGRYEEATAQFRKTLEVPPRFFVAHWGLGQCFRLIGREAEAIEALERAVALSDGSANMLAWLGQAHGAAGDAPGARAILDRLDELSGRTYSSPFHHALVFAGLSDADRTLEWLERAFEDRSGWMVFLPAETVFEPLASDPRYLALLGRVGPLS